LDQSGLNIPRVKRRLILGELDHVSGELTGRHLGPLDADCVMLAGYQCSVVEIDIAQSVDCPRDVGCASVLIQPKPILIDEEAFFRVDRHRRQDHQNDPTVAQLCTREKCSVRQVNMTISLAFLAPNLVKSAVEGRLPRGIGIEMDSQRISAATRCRLSTQS
jgi:hypothetical protein